MSHWQTSVQKTLWLRRAPNYPSSMPTSTVRRKAIDYGMLQDWYPEQRTLTRLENIVSGQRHTLLSMSANKIRSACVAFRAERVPYKPTGVCQNRRSVNSGLAPTLDGLGHCHSIHGTTRRAHEQAYSTAQQSDLLPWTYTHVRGHPLHQSHCGEAHRASILLPNLRARHRSRCGQSRTVPRALRDSGRVATTRADLGLPTQCSGPNKSSNQQWSSSSRPQISSRLVACV